ncbi:MAG TPA: putative toxin-antitoxin system toxin component, PIN family [Burkholderiaceae bacterium]|nr:putative toxin-antitoxin system toxin component, PIN family [Burkholderiaceae bacterium]
MRVFIDTNVLIAAFATRGLCADVFRLAATDHELLIGAPVLVEVRRILRAKLRMPAPGRNEVLQVLGRFVQVPAAKAPVALGIDDLDDEWVVACAIAASADVFVTGDKALLGLRRVKNLPIVSPREFWTQLTAE